MLVRFFPTTNLGDIIDEVMVERWTQVTKYEAYYKVCQPLKCVSTYSGRLDMLYVITILTALFGGLSVSFRVISPVLIKVYVRRRLFIRENIP
ncbi:unnamed protein product, partial [Rotaria sordida]